MLQDIQNETDPHIWFFYYEMHKNWLRYEFSWLN